MHTMLILASSLLGPEAGVDHVKEAKQFAALTMNAIRVIGRFHIEQAPEAQMARWAVQGLFDAVKQPMSKSLRQRLEDVEKLDSKGLQALLLDGRLELKHQRDLRDEQDVAVCIDAMLAGLEPKVPPDRRSRYIAPKDAKPLGRGGPVSTPVGIGLTLEQDKASGWLRVVTPILNSPSYKAGIRAGDLITEIRVDTDQEGGKLPEPLIVSTRGLSVQRADALLLGEHGTSVVLKVLRK